MEPSILTSTKKLLGLDPTYTVFDLDIITHINSTLAIVSQLGVGQTGGVFIQDATATWDALSVPTDQLNLVRNYVALKVRLLFDPPSTSFHITAMEKQITEHEWRLSVLRESVDWVDPNPAEISDTLTVIDGGTIG